MNLAALSKFMGDIHRGCPHLGGVRGVSNNVEKSGQIKTGGLAVGGHPFHCCLCKREWGI